MSNIDLVKATLAAFEAGDTAKAASMLADDMVFAGPVPQPIPKSEYVGLQSALIAAIPNWKFNLSDLKEDGDKVMGKVHISGTHTQPLTLPALGIQALPPSGKHIQLPHEPITVTIKNGKATRIEAKVAPGGGVPGLLAQLGVNIPH
jgi:predicted ester cyclase